MREEDRKYGRSIEVGLESNSWAHTVCVGRGGVVLHLRAIERQELQHGNGASAVVQSVVVGHNPDRHAPVQRVQQGGKQGERFIALFSRRAAGRARSGIVVDVSSALREPGPG